ncbi:CocE/NonD family hydrolase [Novosphingobium rosa]|uniref:CocE/NonD family hydrolase n=1 Tax=Novosphingobium rosa TaxID=76978 RepID=UPI000A04AFFA|nr:CocE/NonD family hydrolase [Novosphingobium rosa]
MMRLRLLGALALVLAVPGGMAQAAPAAQPVDPAPRQVVVDWHVPITMRDGVTLNANIYRPAASSGPLPVVLTITPYTIDTLHKTGSYFARHGFVYAAVDTRGRGGSQGVFRPTTHEAEDGVDVIDWLAHRPFSDGRVVMWGGSYAGRNQLVIATQKPEALKAIAPVSAGFFGVDRGMRANIPITQPMTWEALIGQKTANPQASADNDYWLGAMAELASGKISFRQFDSYVGLPSAQWQANLQHPTLDAYWANTTGDASALTAAQLSRVTIPVLAITGDYDASQVGLRHFMALHDGAVTPADRAMNAMVIGAWDHHATREAKRIVGGVDFGPGNVVDLLDLHRQWYDWVLGRGPKPAFLTDQFVYYQGGANAWRSAPSLAAATVAQQTLWLASKGGSSGSLATHGVLAENPGRAVQDGYVYDPSVPGRNEGIEGYDMVSPDYLTNDAAVRRLNGEGLVYETPVLDKPLDLAGIPSAELWLSMDVPDTDIRVALYAVQPDGTQIFLSQDQIRARYRTSLERETLVTPGKLERYDFHRFDFLARRIPAGGRLRLVISPLGLSLHDERNRNSGGVVADETTRDNRTAHVTLWMGPGRSQLHLPIAAARQ